MNFCVCCLHTSRLISDEKTLLSVVCSGYLNNRELCYDMGHRRRGKLIIISNHKFLKTSSMAAYPRDGTECDVKNLQSTFGQLGFDCEVLVNRTSAQMLKIFLDGMQLSCPRIFVYFCCQLVTDPEIWKAGHHTQGARVV